MLASILEEMENNPGSLDSHVISSGASMAISRIRVLEKALQDTREEICRGPVDDVLWHQGSPACTSVDNITLTLGDGDHWDFTEWMVENVWNERR